MAEKTVMMSYVDAINVAIKEEMRRDSKVITFGEDLASMGGPFTEAAGLFAEFGPDRVRDTPVTEEAIVGMAYGFGMTGYRPLAFLMFGSLVVCAADQIFLKLGSNRQEWGWYGSLPVVIYGAVMGGSGIGEDHAFSPEALLVHCPGLKVVMPATPYDAKGLMKAAIRDNEPVIYMAHMGLYLNKGPVPTDDYIVPLGQADVKKQGTDVSIVTYSATVPKAMAASEQLSKEGISAEVVDLRSLVPMDIDTVVKSVKKTGRLLVVHEAMKRGGVGAEIIARFLEAAPDALKKLKAPIKRVACKNVVLLRAQQVEPLLLPQVTDIVAAVKEMI